MEDPSQLNRTGRRCQSFLGDFTCIIKSWSDSHSTEIFQWVEFFGDLLITLIEGFLNL